MFKSIINTILLPDEVYNNLSPRPNLALCLGIVAVGIHDMLRGVGGYHQFYLDFIAGKTSQLAYYNLAMVLLLSFAIGVADIFLFILPMNWCMRTLIQGNQEMHTRDTFIKTIKIYVYSHIPMIVIGIGYLALYFGHCYYPDNIFMVLALYLIEFWFVFIIMKGFSTVYNAKGLHKVMIFIAIYCWTFISGMLLSYGIDAIQRALLA